MSADAQRSRGNRLLFLGACFLAAAVILLARLVYWQIVRREDYRLFQTGSGNAHAMALRGTIYDAHGHYLAVPSLLYDVGVSPRAITDATHIVGQLAPLLQVDEGTLREALRNTDREYVPLAQGLPASVGRRIKALGLFGVKLDVRPGRYYPEGRLAAAVLGFVNSTQQGYYGIEERYDMRLRGTEGFRISGSPQVLFDLPFVQAPRNGADLYLTIDRVVQRAAEKHLQAALTEYAADSGCIIVVDPRSGAILAMAVAPTYDPNNLANITSFDIFVNSAISRQYEPGSVFKIVTMAIALDAGAITRNERYWDAGKVEVGERIFQNWDRKAHGSTTMTEILAKSLNVGSIYVAQKLGPSRFYDGVRRFGFGELTEVDLAGEIRGTVRQPGEPDWYPADLAANSFGQGLAVTPLQMVMAVAAVANKGVLMQPYVVSRVEQDGEVIWQATPQPRRRVISQEAAEILVDMLVDALPQETPLAVVPHYTSAGKTGTAQVFKNGRYDDEEIIASFAGFLPADNPRFVALVKLDRPRRQAWGSRAAAPVWRDLAAELCGYLGIPPDGTQLGG